MGSAVDSKTLTIGTQWSFTFCVVTRIVGGNARSNRNASVTLVASLSSSTTRRTSPTSMKANFDGIT